MDHRDIVAEVAAELAPGHTLESSLAFLLRVIARLNQRFPSERAGLLEKVAGESIAPYNGTLVSVSRICYPDQRLVKILTDVPTTNGIEWVEDGFASIGGFLKGYLAVESGTTAPIPPPVVPVVEPPASESLLPRFDTLDAAIAALNARLDSLATKSDLRDLRQQFIDGAKTVAATKGIGALIGGFFK